MSQNKYDCSTNRKVVKGSIHNISDDVMKKLPELLANPLVIAEPTDNSIYDGNNRYVVTIDALDNDNNPINVIIDYDWTGNKINIIPSVYGKEEFDSYLKTCIKQNKIIYTNKKVLTSRTRVQFPRGSKNFNNIITDKEDIINSIVKNNLQNNPNNVYYQSAYHGTKVRGLENTGFDLSYALSGEGAMAHGYGVYTAKNKDVSEGYRKKLAQAPANINPLYKQLYLNGGKSNVIKHIQDSLDTLKQAFNNAKNNNEKKEYAENIKNLEKQISIIEDFEDDNLGQLYEVDIPEDDVMLDEDLLISKQPKKVQEALEDLFFDEFGVIMNNSKSITKKRDTLRISIRDKYREIDKLENKTYPFEKRTVEQQIEIEDKQKEYRKLQRIYNTLGRLTATSLNKNTNGKNIYICLNDIFGSSKKVSKLLNEYGIKGIKYNGHQDGECYVVFDDKAVQVLNVNASMQLLSCIGYLVNHQKKKKRKRYYEKNYYTLDCRKL